MYGPLVTAELDAGPIIAQARVPVLPDDDAQALAARVLREEHRIYPVALNAVARSLAEAPSQTRALSLFQMKPSRCCEAPPRSLRLPFEDGRTMKRAVVPGC